MQKIGLVGREHIETTIERATEVKEGIYRGVITGSLYDSRGRILTKSTPLFTTADAGGFKGGLKNVLK